MLYLLAAIHALVDAACAAKLYSAAGSLTVIEISSWFLLYNLIAFSTQAILGGILDTVFHRQMNFPGLSAAQKHGRGDPERGLANPEYGLSKPNHRSANPYLIAAVAGAVIVALGASFTFALPVSVCMVALGNSLFHTGGGGYCLSVSRGKAAGIGLFVGPGSLGLVLGTIFPAAKAIFAAGLIIFGIAVMYLAFTRDRFQMPQQTGALYILSEDKPQEDLFLPPWTRVMIAAFLCLAVVFRAFGGSFPSYSWKKGIAAVIIAAIFVMAGKIAGGIACDKFGAARTIIVSSLLALVIIAFFPDNAPASLAGIFALNMAMPVTLILLYRSMYKYPAFAFGLAASVLFPGALLGTMAGNGMGTASSLARTGIFISFSLIALIFVLVSCMLIARRGKKEDFL